MSAAGEAVFLSYAREDAPAARCIAEALRATGIEVWFDEDELRGGDSWDAKIRQQIKECAFCRFGRMPIISANTQARVKRLPFRGLVLRRQFQRGMEPSRYFASANRADRAAVCTCLCFREMENHIAADRRKPVERVCRIKKHFVWFHGTAGRTDGDAKQSIHRLEIPVLTQPRGRKNDEKVRIICRREWKFPNLPLLHELRLRPAARATALTSAASSFAADRDARFDNPRPAAVATALVSVFLLPKRTRGTRLEREPDLRKTVDFTPKRSSRPPIGARFLDLALRSVDRTAA